MAATESVANDRGRREGRTDGSGSDDGDPCGKGGAGESGQKRRRVGAVESASSTQERRRTTHTRNSDCSARRSSRHPRSATRRSGSHTHPPVRLATCERAARQEAGVAGRGGRRARGIHPQDASPERHRVSRAGRAKGTRTPLPNEAGPKLGHNAGRRWGGGHHHTPEPAPSGASLTPVRGRGHGRERGGPSRCRSQTFAARRRPRRPAAGTGACGGI